ncbi:MAG: hypothetical protein AAB585_00200, partial [Patescibacteria group bacterium]
NALGFLIHFARPPIPSRARRGEGRIPFELFQEYTAKQLIVLREDENAGVIFRQQTESRGGAQTEASDGEPRVAGDSSTHRKTTACFA